jgi:dTDP-4-dehydrorhamnose 3,5-epimerase
MIFAETKLKGAFVIEPEMIEDERGFFARTWSRREFAEYGLNSNLAECNISFNKKRSTLRGMHYQIAPYRQAKLVRCAAGSIYDVIIDLRKESDTFRQWVAVELSAENRLMVYVPEEFAHGFQTLEDNAEVVYLMSEVYDPASARGVRWDDALFSIEWPAAERTIISRDRMYPDFLGS